MSERDTVLEVENLKKYFPVRTGLLRRVANYVQAVDNVSFSIPQGKTLGLVGESGCGKSTTGRAVLRLIEPDAGNVFLEDEDVLSLSARELRKVRRKMQIIFQDPESALNPRMKVEDIVAGPLDVHRLVSNEKEREERVAELLVSVGLSPQDGKRYPHDFSGGQKQRIGIARAIAANPSLIIADEPVSSLDVSIQAQVINLMRRLQREFHLTYLFISHDLGVVRHVSDRIAVMYLGKIVENASSSDLFSRPLHPYTRLLLSAVPTVASRKKRERRLVKGEVPSPIDPPAGCRFHTKCFYAKEVCREREPELIEQEDGHFVACHFWEQMRDEEVK